jgi:hypothetical protein
MAEDEAFKQELATARRAMFEPAMNRLQPLAAQAVDTLAALMQPSERRACDSARPARSRSSGFIGMTRRRSCGSSVTSRHFSVGRARENGNAGITVRRADACRSAGIATPAADAGRLS